MKTIYQKVRRHIRPILGILVLLVAKITLIFFHRYLLKENIWLICEKRNEARDNGYHFYRYLKKEHPEINSYYVITKDSADLHKIEKLGNIIYADTFKHALYYLAAVRSISSQAYGAFPFGLNQKELRLVDKLCNVKQRVVHLRHGIQKDALAHSAFDYDKCNIDLIVCAAQEEYEYVKREYGYPNHAIGLFGFCRFDNLHNVSDRFEKILLVMPTWRSWLKREKDGVPLTQSEKNTMINSEFYSQYSQILSSPKLLQTLAHHGYKICFYLHYQLQDYVELFREFENDHVVIADRKHYDVQDLLIRSKILLTDYSSVQFDFGYMNKPVLYFHFDIDRFLGNHYAKGYYDYHKHGFGPVCMDANDAIDIMAPLIESDAELPAHYQKRVDAFFSIRDNRNCERIFEAVKNLK